MRVSLIIPVLNEAKVLPRLIAWVAALRPAPWECVVVDGGSTDGSVALIEAEPALRLVRAPRGRAAQLNAGAAAATGDAFWFVHADCEPPVDGVAQVARTLAGSGVVAGAFRTWAVRDRPTRLGPLVHIVDVRSRLTRYPYGDQAVFVRAPTFRAVGGFRSLALMEDLDLSRRLWAQGRLVTVPARVRVSARRAIARPVKFTLVYNTFPWLYRIGVSTERLAAWYGAIR